MVTQKLKTFCEKKVFSVFEGLKGGPFEHTKKNFHKKFFLIFFSPFIKNAFYINSGFFFTKKCT